MIDVSDIAAFRTSMATQFGATIVTPDNPVRDVVTTAAVYALKFAKVDASILFQALDHLDSISVTIGTFVFLSKSAVADPISEFETITHECAHVDQVHEDGLVQSTFNYLFSQQLRTKREADAYGAGAFVRYLLEGRLPGSDETVTRLSDGPYALADDYLKMAKGIAESHILTMSRGIVPNIKSAVVAHAWLKANRPDLIAVDAFRV